MITALLLFTALLSWETGDAVSLVMNDGRRITGILVSLDDNRLVLNRNGVRITFERGDIRSLEQPDTSWTRRHQRGPSEPSEPPQPRNTPEITESDEIADKPPEKTGTAQDVIDVLLSTPPGRPKKFTAAWTQLGSRPLESLATLEPGDLQREDICRELIAAKAGIRKSEAWIWYLGWSQTEAWTRALQDCRRQLPPLDHLKVLLNVMGRDDLHDAGALHRHLEGVVKEPTAPGSFDDLKELLLYRVRSGPVQGRRQAATLLGMGRTALSARDWTFILDSRQAEVRTAFLDSLVEHTVRVSHGQLILKSVMSDDPGEFAAALKILDRMTPSPSLDKATLTQIWKRGATAQDPVIRDITLRTLKARTGNPWPLKAAQWKKYFED